MRRDTVTRGAATIAIVRTRLYKELRFLTVCASACAFLAYLQRYDGPALQLAGSLVFGTMTGIVAALLGRGSGRLREIELCEQSAPLYGRELARATALVPCIVTTLAIAAYWIVAAAYARISATDVVLSAAVTNTATLVALRAALSRGLHRALWIAAGAAIAAGGYLISEAPIAFAMGACSIAGFLALRQYGEALARYDPLDCLSRRRGGEFF